MKTIFVSSTFADMQQERDILRDHVAAKINAEARQWNDHIEFCDLRWGINTEDMETESASKKVLDVCLDEIDRSDPPMIILLGDRYGWIPDRETVLSIAEKKKMILDDLQKSATALEAEYGTMGRKVRALVYVRRIEHEGKEIPGIYLAEDKEHMRLLKALKDRLAAVPNCTVRQYSVRFEDGALDQEDLLRFAEEVTADLQQALRPDWEKFARMTAFERERERQWTFIREKSAMFSARYADLNALMAQLRSGRRIVVCKGAPGSGKSTLASKIALKAEEEGWDVLPFIGGLTHESNDATDVLRNSVYYLEERLQRPHLSEMAAEGLPEEDPSQKGISLEQWQRRLKELAKEYEKTGRKMLVLVDALDQLFPDEVRDSCGFIPAGVSKSIQFFLTALPDTEIPEKTFYALNPLTREDRGNVMAGVLRRFGKELPQRVMDHLLELPAADNPYYISMAVQRLCMMESTDFEAAKASGAPGIIALGNRQIEILDKCPRTVEQMCVEIFSVAARRINEEMLKEAAALLAASRYGLRRSDLAGILGDKWNELDFAHFLNYLYEDFQIRTDGRIDFMHKTIRRGLRLWHAGNPAHDLKLAEYLNTLDPHESLRMDELPYHLKWGEDTLGFLNYLYQYELGEKRDTEITRHAAATMREVCLEDDGDFMAEALEKSLEGHQWASLMWFGLKELNDTFGRQYQEETIKARLLTEYKKAFVALEEKGKLSEKNREIFAKEISDQIVYLWNRITDTEVRDWAGSTKLAIAKQKYNVNSLEQRAALFRNYYEATFVYKGASDKSMLEKGLRIAEEGAKLLDEELLLYLSEKHASGGSSFFGCMGEMYMRIGDYDKCLETYQRDLETRIRICGEDPDSYWLLVNLSGGYANVASAHALFQNKTHYAAAYEAACKEIACLEKAEKVKGRPVVLLGTGTAGMRYFKAAYYLIQQSPSLYQTEDRKLSIDKEEAIRAIRWILKGWDLQKDAYDQTGDPEIALEAWSFLDFLQNCVIPEELHGEIAGTLKKWITIDEEAAFKNDDPNRVNELLRTYDLTAAVIVGAAMSPWYDLALECCNKRIRLVEEEDMSKLAGWGSETYRKGLSDAYCRRTMTLMAIEPRDLTPLKENMSYEEELTKKYGSPSERQGDLYDKYARCCLILGKDPLVALYASVKAVETYRKVLETQELEEEDRERIRRKMAKIYRDFHDLEARERGLRSKDMGQLILMIISKMDAEHRPKPAKEVPEKVLENAVASYAQGVDPAEIVAINPGGTFSRGKNGVLYTAKAIYGSVLEHGSSIPYAEIREIHRYGDKLRFWMKDGRSIIADFGPYRDQVYRIVMSILQ